MIKEKELQKAVVSNKLITHKATDLTIMSYDKNVHKLIIPTDLTQAEISDIIVLITFRYHDNIIQISGELVEDKIEIILPNEIRSLSGEFYIEIDINLTDNRQITFARYRANVVKSDIDSIDLDDAQEFYFELFDDFVKQVADKSEISVAEIDAHKQAVSDKADTAIAVIDDATDSVTTAKQSALTSITQATSDVTDASTQFTADLADTQSTIDAQVTQAQDSLQEASDTLTAVNDKAATVNDTADAFMADVADKSQLVDDKYQQFDDNVTTAGQTIDDILGLADDVQQVSAQVSEKVQNFKVKNEIANGDFSQGTTGWERDVTLLPIVDNNRLKITANNQIAFARRNIINNINDKIYTMVKVSLESLSALSHNIIYQITDVPGNAIANVIVNTGLLNQWQKLSVVVTSTVSTTRLSLGRTTKQTYTAYFDDVIMVNLTETFGVGNEPTKSEMDTLINILGGWFDGEIALTQKQQLNWLLKLIRQNALATTALGGTIL